MIENLLARHKLTKVSLVIRLAYKRMSYDVLFLPFIPDRPHPLIPFKNVMNIFLKCLRLIQFPRHANFFLCLPFAHFDHPLKRKCAK